MLLTLNVYQSNLHLNSNMELLIFPNSKGDPVVTLVFKFQYGATNIVLKEGPYP